jgi:hypothetical protein
MINEKEIIHKKEVVVKFAADIAKTPSTKL